MSIARRRFNPGTTWSCEFRAMLCSWTWTVLAPIEGLGYLVSGDSGGGGYPAVGGVSAGEGV